MLRIITTITIIITLLASCRKARYNSPADPTSPIGFFLSYDVSKLFKQNTNQDPAIEVSGIISSIAEGEGFSIGVKLSKEIKKEVVVTIQSNNSYVTLDNAATKTLTFTPETYSTEQKINISTVEDNNSVSESVTMTFSADGFSTMNQSFVVIDDLAIVVNNTSTSINEGETKSIQVRLSKPIYSDKIVQISSDRSALTVNDLSTTSLTFTPANYSTPQNVNLKAVIDANSISEIATISFTSPSIPSVSYILTIIDDLSIVVTDMPSSITEGQTLPVKIKMSKTPVSDLIVNITSTNSSILVDNGQSKTLNFTVGNATVDQVVYIYAIDDVNVISESGMVIFQSDVAASAVYSLTTIDTTLARGFISVTGFPTYLSEGTSNTVGVRFSTGVLSNTIVTIASSNPAIQINGGSSVQLTFTTSNSTLDQAILITAIDDVNVVSESLNVTFSAPTYATITAPLVAIDNDTLDFLVSSVSSVAEDGTGTIQISLTKEPPINIAVNLVSNNPAILGLSTSTLTFTPANYSTPQTLTMNGIVDANAVYDTTSVTISASGIPTKTHSMIVAEKNTGIVITGATTVKEGRTTTLQVKLSENPGMNKTVSFSSSNTGAITVSPASMTFTDANWNTTQNLTVTGVNDGNHASESVTLTANGTGLLPTIYNMTTQDVEVRLKIDGVVYVSGSTYTFPTMDFGYEYKKISVVLENTAGRSSNLMSQVMVTGNDQSHYAITQPTSSFGTSIPFTVYFQPTYFANFQATLNVYHNDTEESPYQITLVGNTMFRTFVDNMNGTVSLPSKGLMFMKCSQGQTWDAGANTCTGTAGTYQFCSTNTNDCNNGDPNQLLGSGFLNGATSSAYNTCNDLVFGGHDDWRVPTVGELGNILYCYQGYIRYTDTSSGCNDSSIGYGGYIWIDSFIFPVIYNTPVPITSSVYGGISFTIYGQNIDYSIYLSDLSFNSYSARCLRSM